MGFSVLLSFLHLKDWKVLVTDVCVKFNNSQKTTNFQKIVSLTFINKGASKEHLQHVTSFVLIVHVTFSVFYSALRVSSKHLKIANFSSAGLHLFKFTEFAI